VTADDAAESKGPISRTEQGVAQQVFVVSAAMVTVVAIGAIVVTRLI
jgi:hypothetical protein